MNTQQEMVIELLARGITAKAAAEQAGTTTRSIRRWKSDPEFFRELRNAVAEYRDNLIFSMDAVVRRARAEESLAFDRTRELMHGDSAVDINRACNLAHNTALKWMKFIVTLANAETGRDIAAMTHALAKAYPDSGESAAPQASSLPVQAEELNACATAGSSSSANAERDSNQSATSPVTSTVNESEPHAPARVAPIAELSGSRSDSNPREEPAIQPTPATPATPAPVPPSPSSGRGPGGGVTSAENAPIIGSERESQNAAAVSKKPYESGQKRTPENAAPNPQPQALKIVGSNLDHLRGVSAPNAPTAATKPSQPQPGEKIMLKKEPGAPVTAPAAVSP